MRRFIIMTLIPISLTTSGCGNHTYTTLHGIDVYCQKEVFCWAQEDVEEATEAFLKELGFGSEQEEAREIDHEISIEVHPGVFPCNHGGRRIHCRGTYQENDFGKYMHLAYTECIADSSIFHEYAHWHQKQYYGDGDGDHSNERFFPEACDRSKACQDDSVVSRSSEITARRVGCEEAP